ncbi:hypothetical protein PoB_002746800 [Plakobranchus ocellatus]|uniref:Uncharacterized protein n=1 Tax=Plakobranchus ocellatus TaxID=259542 RepID=A0AAV4A2P0_9GAST|nr:hypothetical protein PoB_002746800 [Plakobranchus ocellatus]
MLSVQANCRRKPWHIYCSTDTVWVGMRITEDHYPTRQFPSTLRGSRQGHLEHVRHGGLTPKQAVQLEMVIKDLHILRQALAGF